MTTSIKTGSQPINSSQRLQSLDIIRGVALLGILLMNIQAFAMVFSAYGNPVSFGDISGINYYVYYFCHLFADQKFMTIFSLLFGTGILLMADNINNKQGNATKIHYKRMLFLAIFGLAHGYLLWFGDILFGYALAGMVAYLMRERSAKQLFSWGLILISLCSALILLAGLSLPYWEQSDLDTMLATWAPSQEVIDNDILANQSSWLGQMEQRHLMSNKMHGNIMLYLLRVVGLMLIGMACYKVNFFGNAVTKKTLAYSGIAAFVIGLTIIAYGNTLNFASGWQLESMFIGFQYNYWGSLAVAYSYLAFLIIFCRSQVLTSVKTALANVGKMALSNYLMQSIICGFIFYGWGLGYYASVDRAEQLLVVIVIWLFQLLFSSLWLQHFRFGPFEWLWRSLTYSQLQTIKH